MHFIINKRNRFDANNTAPLLCNSRATLAQIFFISTYYSLTIVYFLEKYKYQAQAITVFCATAIVLLKPNLAFAFSDFLILVTKLNNFYIAPTWNFSFVRFLVSPCSFWNIFYGILSCWDEISITLFNNFSRYFTMKNCVWA